LYALPYQLVTTKTSLEFSDGHAKMAASLEASILVADNLADLPEVVHPVEVTPQTVDASTLNSYIECEPTRTPYCQEN
jgi:hypothetical protein